MTVLESDRRFRLISQEGCYLALLMMIFLAAFRHGVGTDWDAYLDFYKNTEESSRVEIGYSYLNNFFSNAGIHYNIFLLFMNVVCVALIASFFRQAGALSAAAILIFYSDLFLYLNLSGMRQAIAISITCFALRYAIKKESLPFFSLVALAAFFHVSAIVFFFGYFIPRVRLKFQDLLWIGFGGLAIYKLLEPMAQLITENTLKNVSYYLDGIEVQEDVMFNYIVGGIKRLAVLGVVLAAWSNLKKKPYSMYILNMYILGLLIYFLFYTISADIGVRMSSYFTIFDALLIGLSILNAPNLITRMSIASFVSAISLYKLLGYASNPYYDYKFIFQQ